MINFVSLQDRVGESRQPEAHKEQAESGYHRNHAEIHGRQEAGQKHGSAQLDSERNSLSEDRRASAPHRKAPQFAGWSANERAVCIKGLQEPSTQLALQASNNPATVFWDL